jgi:glucose/arabinose dehydrogenase
MVLHKWFYFAGCLARLATRAETHWKNGQSKRTLRVLLLTLLSGQGVVASRVVAQAGPPTSTYAASSVLQSAQVLTLVSDPPTVRVTDAQGRNVSGATVVFRVAQGGGSLEGVSTLATNASGLARIQGWRLGGGVGVHRVIGEVAGLAPVVFEAEGTPDSRGSFVVVDGDNQVGVAGSQLSREIVVRVLTQNGVAVQGRTVTFAPSGRGQVSIQSAFTDVQGYARTRWSLGDSAGAHSLIASSASFPDINVSAQAVSATEPTLTREVVVSGISRPWDIAFSPDGAMFFTLRSGSLRVRLPNGTVNRLLESIPDLNPRTQSGLLGLAVDPAFATNRFLYVFLSSNRGGVMDNRIRKFAVNSSYSSVTEVGDIVTGMTWGSDGGHSGGRVRFGPDGYLYITTGDTRSALVPQSVTALGGKVLRITTNGAPAPGNLTLGAGSRAEIYAYGFRNPQGLAFEPSTGRPFTCEHGPQINDEITWVRAGGNGGWDPNDGAGNYSGYSGPTGAPMTDLVKFPQALRAAYRLVDAGGSPDSAGMAGCTFIVGPQWGAWQGALVVALLEGASARVIRIGSDGVTSGGPIAGVAPRTTMTGNGRLRSIVQGPDGALYAATDEDNGQIVRYVPSGVPLPTPEPSPTFVGTPAATPSPSDTGTPLPAPSLTPSPQGSGSPSAAPPSSPTQGTPPQSGEAQDPNGCSVRFSSRRLSLESPAVLLHTYVSPSNPLLAASTKVSIRMKNSRDGESMRWLVDGPEVTVREREPTVLILKGARGRREEVRVSALIEGMPSEASVRFPEVEINGSRCLVNNESETKLFVPGRVEVSPARRRVIFTASQPLRARGCRLIVHARTLRVPGGVRVLAAPVASRISTHRITQSTLVRMRRLEGALFLTGRLRCDEPVPSDEREPLLRLLR